MIASSPQREIPEVVYFIKTSDSLEINENYMDQLEMDSLIN